MKLKLALPFVFFFILIWHSGAQENLSPPPTLEQQFVDVFDKSNRYEDYKVIKIYKLNNLRKNINDSIAAIKKDLVSANNAVASKTSAVESLQGKVNSIQSQLAISQENRNGIEVFGTITKKSTFKTATWSIIIVLLVIIAFLFIKFKNCNITIKSVQLKLRETEEEFETHRHRTVEREQQLRRKLQDEINKNRKIN